ncbi:MAG TPA: hypothetical protein VL485_28125 [Ktedonobacteraceae bacterium]|jgi:probable HAF family extracellular repeat protein|nr:hypothetical protein [Ktedonobacteraceae bacterium]
MFHLYRETTYLLIVTTILGLLLLIMTDGTAVAATTASVSSLDPSFIHTSGSATSPHMPYQFLTLNDSADLTFNQLLGINKHGVIAGYFGSGMIVNGMLRANKGYTLSPLYDQGNYTSENFPGSVQTQVTDLNNADYTAGFWVDSIGNNFGFVQWQGGFTSYKDPHTGTSNGVQVNQLLGLNDKGIAVGFYTDSKGNDHAYTLDQNKGKFSEIPTASIPGAVSAMATGINNDGDVVGSYTDASGTMHGFLLKESRVSVFDYPGIAHVTGTTFLGINSND